ncbi:hypothetical protein PATSB16_15850 [Pandoraea thiooxydans]|uniref:YtkA-like domain-containing protein n=2 Tax=Pandoraea thiooxydans TaxID=445709 RepID=A0A0U4ELD5_9BURK|nr:hypothetical protein ABW99_20910 [Pandoraea thiooxydans]APR94927.1 hypothetical protein PATSB16_15850 [Pandoraea thiooxydans]
MVKHGEAPRVFNDGIPIQTEKWTDTIMNIFMRRFGLGAALLTALTLATPAARAQQQKSIDGLHVNIGVVVAQWAQHFPEESTSHPNLGKAGSDHHLVVSLTDKKTGAKVADAEVSADVRGPNRQVQEKKLVPRVTSGVPDYSETFDMSRPGRYRITVYVKTKAHPKPLVARLNWTNPG